jgi:pyruvate dehydrogenase (quinone)
MTDPNALAMPPKMEFAQVKGFAETMGKLMINGQTAEMIEIAKSSMKYLKEVL